MIAFQKRKNREISTKHKNFPIYQGVQYFFHVRISLKRKIFHYSFVVFSECIYSFSRSLLNFENIINLYLALWVSDEVRSKFWRTFRDTEMKHYTDIFIGNMLLTSVYIILIMTFAWFYPTACTSSAYYLQIKIRLYMLCYSKTCRSIF